MESNQQHDRTILKEDFIKYAGYSIGRIGSNTIEIKFEKGFEGELEDAKVIVQRISQFCLHHEPVFLLAVYAEDNFFSKEARQYIASKEINAVVKAEALVITSMALRIMGNFYLKVNKPARASRLFNDRMLALEWLNQRL
jgi:hypothetical protein